MNNEHYLLRYIKRKFPWKTKTFAAKRSCSARERFGELQMAFVQRKVALQSTGQQRRLTKLKE
jgi:hypothetical protein